MNSLRFRDIPPATDFKIPFPLKEKHLLEWLQGLSKQQVNQQPL